MLLTLSLTGARTATAVITDQPWMIDRREATRGSENLPLYSAAMIFLLVAYPFSVMSEHIERDAR